MGRVLGTSQRWAGLHGAGRAGLHGAGCLSALPSYPPTGALLELLPRWAQLSQPVGSQWPAVSVLCVAVPAILIHTADEH